MYNSIPWIEKYRPSNIDAIIYDENVRNQLNICLNDTRNVHMILAGPPGCGKSSTAKCIASRLLEDDISIGYLELNSAEARGVKSVSARIPPFCKKMVSFTGNKVILLDEADNMTTKCQNDINTMIKEFGHKTKFIFTCNESNKIIEDIQSVCRIIRYKRLTDNQICSYLRRICNTENVECDDEGLKIICYISNGDMRKAINDLQKTAYTFDKITKETVLKICRVPDPEDIRVIIQLCMQKNICEANSEMDRIISQGYYYLDIVSGFVFVLSTQMEMKEQIKLMLIDIVQQTKICISTGLRSKLQLTGMLCRLIKVYDNYQLQIEAARLALEKQIEEPAKVIKKKATKKIETKKEITKKPGSKTSVKKITK